jgi:hypothetical protein
VPTVIFDGENEITTEDSVIVQHINVDILDKNDENQIVSFIDTNRFSSILKLQGVIIYTFRFIKRKVLNKSNKELENVQAFLDDEAPDVCSFQSNPECAKDPTMGTFSQIQLFDNSLHLVKSLQLIRTQVTEDEFQCIGAGLIIGSSKYCERHKCAKQGTKFCYYSQNEIVYFNGAYEKVPIKAWGIIKIPYYSKLISIPQCKNCNFVCIKGGVELRSNSTIDKAESAHSITAIMLPIRSQSRTFTFPWKFLSLFTKPM